MAQPRALILRAPGTNCDLESAHAFERAGAKASRVHVNRVLENPALIGDYQILCLAGGFSYGDDIAAGRILGNQMRHHLAEVLQEFKQADKLILGICNGFQILLKTEVLLPSDAQGPQATLAWNESGKYEARWVNLQVQGTKSVFLKGLDRIYLPVAHAEGRFVPRDAQVFSQLETNGQLVLRYVTAEGGTPSYPECPNGAHGCVAGMCDQTGRVLGLMPHPERHLDATQHPQWTRRTQQPRAGEGLALFTNAVRYFG